MSTGTLTKCDQCSHEEKHYDAVFGGRLGRSWITVSRGTSSSKDVIGAGTSHFCNEKCLLAYLNQEDKW